MGEILEAVKKLRSTAKGRTYAGFTAFLNDADQQALVRGHHRRGTGRNLC